MAEQKPEMKAEGGRGGLYMLFLIFPLEILSCPVRFLFLFFFAGTRPLFQEGYLPC